MEGERERWREGGSARLHVRRNEIRAEGERVREGRREVDIRKVCSSRKAGEVVEETERGSGERRMLGSIV
jgi:hypothetical protein